MHASDRRALMQVAHLWLAYILATLRYWRDCTCPCSSAGFGCSSFEVKQEVQVIFEVLAAQVCYFQAKFMQDLALNGCRSLTVLVAQHAAGSDHFMLPDSVEVCEFA